MASELQCSIYIGREESNSRLAAFLSPTKGTIIDIQVPQSVSRWKPAELMAHCKLEIYKDSSIKIVNLKPNNVTYVNGQQVQKALIDDSATVQLGYQHFTIPLKPILAKFGYKKAYKIDHLQGIYEDYHNKLVNMQLEQTKEASRQRLAGICSTLGMFIMLIPFEKFFGYESQNDGMGIPMIIRMVLMGIALILSISFYLKSRNPANSAVMKRMEINNWLKANYRCPNPECGQPFDAGMEYRRLKVMGKCPYCNCKLTETNYFVNHSAPGFQYS